MALAPPNNALAWAHFRLKGGWSRALTFTGSVLLLGAILIVTSARLNPFDGGRTLWNWTTGMLTVQAISLALLASGRVSAAVRSDIQSRMIESHRLMPLAPLHAIGGYIAGAAASPLIFSTGVFLLGGLTAAAAGVSLQRWVFAHAVLLGFCIFAWVVCAFAAFAARLGGAMLFFPLAIPYMSQGGILALLPALSVLLSPVMGTSIFNLRVTGATLPVAYAIAFAAQAYVGSICYVAAARKYRSADAIGIDTILGTLLVLGWVGMSFAGLREWDDFAPRGWSATHVDSLTQAISSMIGGMFVAIPVVSANAMERIRWRRHERLHDPAPMHRPLPAALVVVALAMLLILIPLSPKAHLPTLSLDTLARSVIVIAMALLGLFFWFETLYSIGLRAGIAVFIWILITWGGPIFIDLVRYSLGDMGENEYFAGFSTCSPIGTLIVLWRGSVIQTTGGMFVQVLILAIPALLWLRRRLTESRRKVD